MLYYILPSSPFFQKSSDEKLFFNLALSITDKIIYIQHYLYYLWSYHWLNASLCLCHYPAKNRQHKEFQEHARHYQIRQSCLMQIRCKSVPGCPPIRRGTAKNLNQWDHLLYLKTLWDFWASFKLIVSLCHSLLDKVQMYTWDWNTILPHHTPHLLQFLLLK